MKNTLLKISVVLLVATVIACGNSTENEENENIIELTDAQLKNTQIVVGKAQLRTLGSEISVNGIIDVPPQGNISINIPYGGFLKFTEMLPGSRVKKGQLLAVIENPEFVDIQQEYLSLIHI